MDVSGFEVFPISPVVGRCYQHAEATRRTGQWPNERYFTQTPPRYVGRLEGTYRRGSGDGQDVWSIFRDGPTENRVDYSYEGNTCFVEVPCRSTGGKRKGKSRRARKGKRSTRRRA